MKKLLKAKLDSSNSNKVKNSIKELNIRYMDKS